MTKNSYSSTKTIFNNLFSSTKHQLLKDLEVKLQGRGSTTVIFTPNLEQLALAEKHQKFAHNLGLADFLLPDGMGLVWGSRFLHFFGKTQPVAERISGREVVNQIVRLIKDRQNNVAQIIGGKDYHPMVKSEKVVGDKTSDLYSDDASLEDNIRQIFWTPGYADVKKPTPSENKALWEKINRYKPAVVFVAFGAPYQEEWIIENKDKLTKAGVKIAMAVGGSFDVIFGKLKRPPEWVEKSGLEWLYRLWQEPWRWRRQLQLFVAVKQIIQLALQDDEEISS